MHRALEVQGVDHSVGEGNAHLAQRLVELDILARQEVDAVEMPSALATCRAVEFTVYQQRAAVAIVEVLAMSYGPGGARRHIGFYQRAARRMSAGDKDIAVVEYGRQRILRRPRR